MRSARLTRGRERCPGEPPGAHSPPRSCCSPSSSSPGAPGLSSLSSLPLLGPVLRAGASSPLPPASAAANSAANSPLPISVNVCPSSRVFPPLVPSLRRGRLPAMVDRPPLRGAHSAVWNSRQLRIRPLIRLLPLCSVSPPSFLPLLPGAGAVADGRRLPAAPVPFGTCAPSAQVPPFSARTRVRALRRAPANSSARAARPGVSHLGGNVCSP